MNALSGGPRDAGVWCVEIDLRSHNREVLVAHPMYPRLKVFDGSIVDEKIARVDAEKGTNCRRVMVILDSNHTHDRVLGDLNLYSLLVSVERYGVVFNTVIEDLEGVEFVDRPWGKGDNPKTAVAEFLKTNSDFEVDRAIDEKFLILVAPFG